METAQAVAGTSDDLEHDTDHDSDLGYESAVEYTSHLGDGPGIADAVIGLETDPDPEDDRDPEDDPGLGHDSGEHGVFHMEL